ncbi:hypothetical protein JCM18909_3435 [Cutibacterium acnes JCM 18909]|nr:hypothetical protein JCM18909_3435 [Cutibacterium acnes JCM 18909]
MNLRLALNGLPLPTAARASYIDVVAPVLARQRELRRELPELLCPADRRIQAFIDRYLGEDSSVHPRLPDTTLTLDEPGLTRPLTTRRRRRFQFRPCLELPSGQRRPTQSPQ